MWLRVTGDPAKNPNQAEKMNRHICNQSHLCFPFKKKKSNFSHYLYWSATISKNAVGEILGVCFCKVKCLGLWNAEMQGRRKNARLYYADMNISKVQIIFQSFFLFFWEK